MDKQRFLKEIQMSESKFEMSILTAPNDPSRTELIKKEVVMSFQRTPNLINSDRNVVISNVISTLSI